MTSFKPVSLAHKIFEPSHDVKLNNPIIFLHGMGAMKEHWMDIPQKVADATDRKVYAIDARNHGESAWDDEFNFDINALDLINFIENIAAEKVTLVGHSMGGITSMKTALKEPSKIDKIIIEDIGITVPKEITNMIKFIFSLFHDAINNIPAGSTKQDALKFLGEFVFQRLPDEVKTLVKFEEHKYKDYLKQNPDGSFTTKSNMRILLSALESDSIVSKYEGVYDGPACFIYGEKSMFPVYQDAEIIKKFFPNAQFVGIPNATHDVHSDEPHRFIEVLLKILKE